MEFDHLGLIPIDRNECLDLLGSAAIGRLALSIQALPVVLPFNFALVRDSILIRTGAGTALDRACDRAVVGFEVDGFDPVAHTGWSVLVQGLARVLDGPAELGDAHGVGLIPWGNEGADTFVRIELDIVTGRRLGGWYWPHDLPVAERRLR